MTTIKLLPLLATICIFLFGCPIRSLSPLFHEKDLVSDQALLGTWKNVENSDAVTFETSGRNSFLALVHEDDGDSSKYEVQLGRLGEYWFADWFPETKAEDYQLIPTHLISRVWLSGDSLRLSFLEGDWVEQVLNADETAVPHARQTGSIILTASTEELQKFVLRHAADGKAFPDPGVFVRAK
ncbi:MAG TPA: hypothetical protein VGA55_01135 [Bacteroidota bacterium]